MSAPPLPLAVEREQLERKLRFKYVLDRIVAMCLLPLLLAVGVVTALAMAVEAALDPASSGSLFYHEERWTQGAPFLIHKFRTTYPGSQAPGQVGRVTRVGHYLKKWYLDELPQLLNILRGDMTLVGPRPNTPGNARREIEDEGMHGKLLLRAGLTGLVQVHKLAARDRDCYRRLEEDYLDEIRCRSPLGVVLYDTTLLLHTIPMMLRGEGL